MVQGDFNLPYLGLISEVAQEFMAIMGLSQIISGLTWNSDHLPDMIFLLEQWQHDLGQGSIGNPPVMVSSC